MNGQEMMNIYNKYGSKWELTGQYTDASRIYEELAHDLINKLICKASYIKRVQRTPRYDGLQKITVWYDNGVKCDYYVANH